MKEKFTPGPWEIEDDNPLRPCFDIVSECENTHISVYTVTEEAIHNAQLIAAAPELLSALQGMLEINALNDAGKLSRFKAANAAIAKALGESQ